MTALINVTQAFREEVFIHDNRSYIYNIRITFQDDTYIDVTNENLMEQGGVVIDEAVSTDEDIGLGSCVVNKLSLTLKNFNGAFTLKTRNLPVAMRLRDTPVPIPNTMVKT